ncbi:outer membrane beta-barrel protein [Caulobacter sp. LARHSG274]
MTGTNDSVGKREIVCAIVLACCATTLPTMSMAQDYSRGRNVSVTQRERPEYDPIGIHAGGFTLLPKVELSGQSISNAFDTSSHEQSDAALIFAPSVLARSNWGRHAMQVQANLAFRRNKDFSENDQTAGSIQALGRIDVYGQSYITILADAARAYDERSSSGFPRNAADLPKYDALGVGVRGVYESGRIRTSGGIETRSLDYGFINSVSGPRLDLNGRDVGITKLTGRVEYGVNPDAAVFTEFVYTISNYDHSGGIYGPSRDSKEASGLIGANFDITRLARGEVGFGYIKREYDSPSYNSIPGVTARAKIEYLPTQLLTLTFDAKRAVIDSVDLTSGGFFSTSAGVMADYELRRNLLVNAKVGYTKEDYRGIDRSDEITEIGVGGRYLVNRTVSIEAKISRYDRESSGANAYRSFTGTDALLTLVLKR